MRRPDYAIPFADLFRELTPAERRELTESITANGVMVAVSVYQSDKHGPSLVDGANRWAISGELGVPCPVNELGRMSDKDARELAEQLNHCRRHLTPADWREMAAKRAERVKRVAEKRQQGKSLRTIADEEGVSEKTVRKDIEESGADGSAPDAEVTGKDGKTYKATKPAKPVIEPPPQDSGDTEDADTDDEVLDKYDVEVIRGHARERSISGDYDGAAKLADEANDLESRLDTGERITREQWEAEHDDDDDDDTTIIGPDPPETVVRERDPLLPHEPPTSAYGDRPPLPGADEYQTATEPTVKEAVAQRKLFLALRRHVREVIEGLDAISSKPCSVHLRNLEYGDHQPIFKAVVYRHRNLQRTIKTFAPLFDLMNALVYATPKKVCDGCRGHGCGSCRHAGFLPQGGLQEPDAAGLPFPIGGDPWDEED